MKIFRGKADRGATAVIVALSLLVLVGFTAIAIDGGRAYNERRSTQNAADHAALAAAWAECVDEDPAVAAENSAVANGYGGRLLLTEDEPGAYRATITAVQDNAFASGIGSDQVTVVSEAVADCSVTQFAGGFALFAGAESCGPNELSLNSANANVEGDVHSNGDLNLAGANPQIDGRITYRGSHFPPVYVGPERVTGDAWPYPVFYNIADYRPGGSKNDAAASTNQQIDNEWFISRGWGSGSNGSLVITRSGIYYTSWLPANPNSTVASISLQNVSVAEGVSVTLVAEGKIHITGSGNLRAHDDMLLLFSNRQPPGSCNSQAIQWSASNTNWTGVLFAPNGVCTDSAASTLALNGSVICYRINFSGAGFNIAWEDNPDFEPEYEVQFIR